MTPDNYALIILFAPVAAFTILGVCHPIRNRGALAGWIVSAATFATLVAAVSLLRFQWENPTHVFRHEFSWLVVNGKAMATVGWHIDGISAPMLVVVSMVALCVQIYSQGYLAHEPPSHRGRYFAWHALFVFAMQSLVMAPNLLQLFMGWELVGLCSYLLIGYYWRKGEAGKASVKAFWVTKFADSFLLLGLIVLVATTGSFDWNIPTGKALGDAGGAFALAGILLFVGAMGKAAQMPLHVWLPDAMAGPTPVSALLHAATMVAAGVYIVVRGMPVFAASTEVMHFICYVGAITAFIGGCLALLQDDIKKMLAFSTCSQLGYMMAALGANAVDAGYFHLTTHAFFKALLFLTAGSLIHAVHSNNMSDMGGLRKKMPLTFILYGIGAFALMGFPMLSGFFSKDLVLAALQKDGQTIPLILCLGGVLITATYMTKSFLSVFFGEAKSDAHESGGHMMIPMLALGVLSVAAGFGVEKFSAMAGAENPESWSQLLGHFVGLPAIGVGLMVVGMAIAVMRHRGARIGLPVAFNNWVLSRPVDRFYETAWRSGLLVFARMIAWVDRYIIDALMNLVAHVILNEADRSRKIQTGRIRDYVWYIAMGALVLAMIGIFGEQWAQLFGMGGGQ